MRPVARLLFLLMVAAVCRHRAAAKEPPAVDIPTALQEYVSTPDDSYRYELKETQELDGHDHKQVANSIEWALKAGSKPRILIAHTIKGKGVSFMENNNHFHGVANTKEETVRALKELGENDAEIARITGMIV